MIINGNSITIRNYHSSDFNNYAQLHIETEKLDQSGHYISKQRLAEDLGHPSFHPENDLFIAEQAGSIIGYASVFLESGIKRALLDGMIHPLQRKKGIATKLFDHALRRAKKAESDVAQIFVPENNLAAKNLALRLGFRFIYHFFELKLNLNLTSLPDVELSEYIIRSLERGEADKLTDIQNRAFVDAWGFNPNTRDEIAYRINLSSCAPEDVVMAYLGDKPVGYCWTRMVIEENSTECRVKGEIHMLGVDPVFRRKGIGRKVLLAGMVHLKNKGVTTVELTADGEDPAALALYESVGFKICSRSEWYEKKLV